MQANNSASTTIQSYRGFFGDPGNDWVTIDRFLYYWNTTNMGGFSGMRWWEEDIGDSATFTTGLSGEHVPGTGNKITLSFGFQWKDNDDDMGATAINFTDPLVTVYNTGYIEWEMK